MTAQEFLAVKQDFIGGKIATFEQGLEYEGTIKDIYILNGSLTVLCTDGGDVSANVDFTHFFAEHNGTISFRIPYVGRATLHKRESNGFTVAIRSDVTRS